MTATSSGVLMKLKVFGTWLSTSSQQEPGPTIGRPKTSKGPQNDLKLFKIRQKRESTGLILKACSTLMSYASRTVHFLKLNKPMISMGVKTETFFGQVVLGRQIIIMFFSIWRIQLGLVVLDYIFNLFTTYCISKCLINTH